MVAAEAVAPVVEFIIQIDLEDGPSVGVGRPNDSLVYRPYDRRAADEPDELTPLRSSEFASTARP
jgi:hypothetical protein